MKKLISTSITLITLLLLFSCSSNDLSREKAKELISEFNSKNDVMKTYRPRHGSDAIRTRMENAGYITYETSRGYKGNYKLLGDAKSFVKSHTANSSGYETEFKILVGTKSVSNITGITYNEDKTNATVEYDEILTYNKFGKEIFYLNDKTEQRSQNLKLYDDGWRIKN